jgi:hypothetical protein
MDDKKKQLKIIYDTFSKDTGTYRESAACEKGCAYCCSGAGNIDITTLEGLVILDEINKMPKGRKIQLEKSLSKDMRKWKEGAPSPCPFLMKNNACMVYDIRPFSCRRIYSNHVCDSAHPPVIHKEVMSFSEKTIYALQKLDDTGYSGHISCILYMLNTPKFLETYLGGGYKPEEVMAFGKTFKIIINRMMLQKSHAKG